MPIIIDGWNFIRSNFSPISDDSGDSLESIRALLAYLDDFQHTHNDPIVLVFDSRNGFLDIERKDSAKLSMRAAKNADNFIKAYIDKVPSRQRRNVRVVSSDKEVYFYAKSSYAAPVKSEEFWEKLAPKSSASDLDNRRRS